jgi:hypothetical protein
MPIQTQDNAVVPEGAALQPPQALVDYAQRSLSASSADTASGFCDIMLNFANLGLVTCVFQPGGWFIGLLAVAKAAQGNSFVVHFDGNNLDADSVQQIVDAISDWVLHGAGTGTTGTLEIAGGTNAAPGDVTALTGAGWTVNHN